MKNNILIDANGRAVVCDFGLSRILHEVTRSRTRIQEGGHLRFLAPELSAGEDEKFRTTTASDVYSLGMALFELLTLEPPFSGFKKRL